MLRIDEVVRENVFTAYDLKAYYTRCISYELTEEKKKGMALFLQKLKESVDT